LKAALVSCCRGQIFVCSHVIDLCVCFIWLQSHPGTNVTVLDLFDRSASLQPLWKQVEGFAEAIYPIMQNAADGIHLICYSQGL